MMLHSKDYSVKTLYLQAAEAIKKKYILNSHSPGLPSIINLAKECGVSKVTAEKAIRLLIQNGELYSINGKGTFVSPGKIGTQATTITQIVFLTGQAYQEETFWYTNAVLRGAEKACLEQGVKLHTLYGSLEQQLLELTKEGFLTQAHTGFMVALGSRENLTRVHELTRAFNRKVVSIENYSVPEIPSVCIDNHDGLGKILTHLNYQGRTQIIYLASNIKSGGFVERAQVFEKLLQTSFPKLTLVKTLPCPASKVGGEMRSGYFTVLDYLKSHGYPFNALVATNDAYAAGAIMALKERGLKIPQDVAVVGFDDEKRITEGFVPSITSVKYSAGELGKRVIKSILGQTTSLKIETTLVIRESSSL